MMIHSHLSKRPNQILTTTWASKQFEAVCRAERAGDGGLSGGRRLKVVSCLRGPNPLKLLFSSLLLLEGHPIGSFENLSSRDLPSPTSASWPPPTVCVRCSLTYILPYWQRTKRCPVGGSKSDCAAAAAVYKFAAAAAASCF